MINNLSNENVIFIDWGTTNLRAYKYNLIKKKIITKIYSNEGILNLKNQLDFIKVLKNLIKKFNTSKNIDIVMAGMVGSKKGLYETNYLTAPTNLKNISKKIKKLNINNFNLYIIPGLKIKKNNFYDVMRGEETIALGLNKKNEIKKNIFLCCPGTHSKWILMNNDKILNFFTFMTGDFYSAICESTILKDSLNISNKNIGSNFFKKGLSLIKKNNSLSNNFFKIRTMDLFNQNKPTDRNSFLSGLIIGSEILDILNKNKFKNFKVLLISDGPLAKLYSISLKFFNIKFNLVNSEECFIQGIKKIYEHRN